MVKDYDCKILYHPGKANMVVDTLSHRVVSASSRGLCMRVMITSPLLELVREAQMEGIKEENWKKAKIKAQLLPLSWIVEDC